MSRRDPQSVIAEAMRRDEWERVGVALLIGVAIAARSLPDASIDDLLALLSDAGEPPAPARRDRRGGGAKDGR